MASLPFVIQQLIWNSAAVLQKYPWGSNALPEDRKLAQKIMGNYSGPGGDLTPVPDFYQMFAVDHNKPMAIVETAAMFNTKAEAVVDAYHMKIKWLEQVLMHARFPWMMLLLVLVGRACLPACCC